MAPTSVATPNTTQPPTDLPVKCPIFTHSGYDITNDQYFCEYASWAYGVFAIAAILLIMVPIVTIICCVVRYRAKKRYVRRLRSTVSTDSYATSNEQSLIPEGTHHQNAVYGSIEPLSPRRSLTADSITELRSESHDNISVVSSRTSLMPNYDQASLDLRNSKAGNTFQNSYDCPEPVDRSAPCPPSSANTVSPYMSSNVISYPTISRSKTNSPIYIVPEEATPKVSPLATNEPEYAVLENPSEFSSDTEEKKADKSKTCHNDEKPSHNLAADSGDNENMLDRSTKCEDVKLQNATSDLDLLIDEAPNDEPVYNILEPTKPSHAPESDSTAEGKQIQQDDTYKKPRNEKQKDISFIDEAESTEDNETTDGPRYMPLVFPKENSIEETESTQPLTKERTKSRADYQEILLDAIKSYPLEERNGCFVLRDSISSPGSKALTVYNNTEDSQQEFYNFKICFEETGNVYLAKSKKKFSSLDGLLEYLRNNKDMLPCTLRNQIA